jgi:hypothetical protein
MASLHTKKLPTFFQELLNIFSQMIIQHTSFTLDNYAEMYSVIVDAYCNFPKFASSNSEFINQILRGAVLALSNVSVEMSTDWSDPVESTGDESLYNNQLELRLCKEIMENIASLALQIGY